MAKRVPLYLITLLLVAAFAIPTLPRASAQVTLNTYAHLLHDAQSRAAAALDELLAAQRPGRDLGEPGSS